MDRKGMKRTFEMCMAARPSALTAILAEERVGADRIVHIKPARRVRLMQALREGVMGSTFYLGEVAAVEAVVEVEGIRGYALRVGEDPQDAVAAAAVLALCGADGNRSQRIGDRLVGEMKVVSELREQQGAAVARTRVRFEGGIVEAYSASDYTRDR